MKGEREREASSGIFPPETQRAVAGLFGLHDELLVEALLYCWGALGRASRGGVIRVCREGFRERGARSSPLLL
jgi:hypothetical protein